VELPLLPLPLLLLVSLVLLGDEDSVLEPLELLAAGLADSEAPL